MPVGQSHQQQTLSVVHEHGGLRDQLHQQWLSWLLFGNLKGQQMLFQLAP